MMLIGQPDERWRWDGDTLRPIQVMVETPSWHQLEQRLQGIETLDAELTKVHQGLPGLVAIQGAGGSRLDGRSLVLTCLQRAHAQRVPVTEMAERVVASLVAMAKTGSTRVEILAPLKNLRVSGDGPIELRDGIELRRLTDWELDWINGSYHFDSWPSGWALSITKDEAVLIGDNTLPRDATDSETNLRDELDRILSAFHVLSSGPISIDKVARRLLSEALMEQGGSSSLQIPVPIRTYHLQSHDVPLLRQWAKALAAPTHSSMEVALSRLGSLSLRRDVRDRIIDAAVGMEALLLSEGGADGYRGELRFRFALNFAFLGLTAATRRESFSRAKAFYDLRSKIAHGGAMPKHVKVGPSSVSIEQAARQMEEALRELVQRFLPEGKTPSFNTPDFWISRYFPES